MPKIDFSRRGVIAASAGGVALAALGALGLSSTPQSLIRAILHRSLPGVKIDEAGLEAFEADYIALAPVLGTSMTKMRAASAAQKLLGLNLLMKAPKFGDTIHRFEREILTMFLVGSDFFSLKDPTAQTVTYIGEHVGCDNPFARTYARRSLAEGT